MSFRIPKDIIFLFNSASAINCLKLLLSSEFSLIPMTSTIISFLSLLESIRLWILLTSISNPLIRILNPIVVNTTTPFGMSNVFFRFGLTIFFFRTPKYRTSLFEEKPTPSIISFFTPQLTQRNLSKGKKQNFRYNFLSLLETKISLWRVEIIRIRGNRIRKNGAIR